MFDGIDISRVNTSWLRSPVCLVQQESTLLEHFDCSRYGKLSGDVINISADANQDEKLGLVYRAMISISEQSIEADGKARELEPGMSLTAEVKLGRRAVMSYLLSTIKQEVDNAGKQK